MSQALPIDGNQPPPRRAVLFIDGSNWYHALIDAGVQHLMELDYARISTKLAGPRTWVATRYYIGQVKQTGNPALYTNQRRFLSALTNTDPRITIHLGRLEPRSVVNEAAHELITYLHRMQHRINPHVFSEMMQVLNQHRSTSVMVEKAVDVMLAVDLVKMALLKEYDDAYILSADGDFTHAVDVARRIGRNVYAATPGRGAQLARAVNTFIPLHREWFDDCYK